MPPLTPARRRAAIVVAVVVLCAFLAADLAQRRGPRPRRGADPVLMIHGYDFGTGCPGADTRKTWFALELLMKLSHLPDPQVPVSYYACDTHGVDITGYGRSAPRGATTAVTASTPRLHYDRNVAQLTIARDLAWFVFHSYSSSGQPVDAVASSMGGLLLRSALQHVADGDPSFPPYLLVHRAVTLSSPFGGGDTMAQLATTCGTAQCRDLATDSPLMAYFAAHPAAPQGRGGTTWTALGSSVGCDIYPGTSTLAITGATRIDYGAPCYTHTGYLYDLAQTRDAHATVTSPSGAAVADLTEQHSLALVVALLAARR